MKNYFKIILILSSISSVMACPVCYGAADEPEVIAAQTGILFLLGIVGFVLSCIGLFMFNLSRKTNKV